MLEGFFGGSQENFQVIENDQVCSDELYDKSVHRVRKWFPEKLEMQAHFEKPCN